MHTIHHGIKGSKVELLLVRPRVAWAMLGCGNTHGYALLNAGELESFMDGAARKITVELLTDLLPASSPLRVEATETKPQWRPAAGAAAKDFKTQPEYHTMNLKIGRPAAPGRAHRAGLFEGGTSIIKNSSANPDFLKAALRRGAAVYIGRHSDRVDLTGLKSFLEGAFPFDDDYRHYQLIGPTAICAHWFGFTGRRVGLNHNYPATFLRDLIVGCFSLDYSDIPMDAVLAGLIRRGFEIERVKPKSAPVFNWAANIRTMTYSPQGGAKLIWISELGKPGAVPPIEISEQEIAHGSARAG